jgi:hypothetical protein
VEDQIPDRNCAKFRQYKEAEQYLLDVFGVTRNSSSARGGSFCTARTLKPQREESAATWPVTIQGPILIQNIDESVGPSLAVVIENFGSCDNFAGISIGKNGCEVDFVALSPTTLIPRFAFESMTDSYDLNDSLYKFSSIVERVRLGNDPSEYAAASEASISLVRDPIANNVLHFATASSISTISTNIMKITCRKLNGETPVIQFVRRLGLLSNLAL